jgi:branched-chain amino acid aminotransferase
MADALLACLDGTVMPPAEASIPATDDGLLRGDGAFEVIRLYDGRPFALAEHLDRLAASARNLRLPLDHAAIEADVAALLAATGGNPAAGCLRIVVTRGGRRLLLTEPLPVHPGAIRLASVTYAPPRLLDGVKSLSYAANMLAGRLARERGADEALLVTPHGRVLEAPTSSVFWVPAHRADGALRTPPLEDHILASITRARVIELMPTQEHSCALEELLAAEEAFLVSTTREVQPIASVDGQALPCGADGEGGPVTREAARKLRERIAAELS